MKYLKTYEESESFDLFMKQVVADCQPYIKFLQECDDNILIDDSHKMLIRGMGKLDVDYQKISEQMNRTSKDTPAHFHNFLNGLFEDKFGWKVRNGAFCFFRDYGRSGYGLNYYVFPIGDFEYCWSEDINDLFGHFEYDFNDIAELQYQLDYPGHNENIEDIEIDLEHLTNEMEFKLDDALNTYTDSDLESVPENVEISIRGDYYIINYKYKYDIFKYIYNQS